MSSSSRDKFKKEVNMSDTPLIPFVSLRNTHIAAGSALLYIIVMGMVNSYSAPATVDMRLPGSRFRDVTPDEITWIASLPQITGIIGNCLAGYITHKLGRQATLMFASTSYVISWLTIAYAPSITIIYTGRLISGLCAGVCCVAVPTYIVEIAPTEIRGLLTSGFQLAFGMGVFIVITLGAVLRWSWLAISGAVFTTCAVCLIVIMPESPPWLIRKSRTDEALRGIKFLKGKHSDVMKEIRDITDNLEQNESDNISRKDFLDPTFYKPVIITAFLMIFQQISGVNVVMAYTVEIFNTIGSSVNPQIASSVVAAVQVVGTVFSGILMDRSGRKLLYIISGSCMAVSAFILGIYSYFSTRIGEHAFDVHSYGWIPLVSLMMYMFSFSLGVGPIPFVMAPEIAPIRFRSMIVAFGAVVSSLSAFIVTKSFENFRQLLGLYGLFWFYAFFALLSAILGRFFLPETKGLTLREISRSFSRPVD
ncbi:facilitated trehalose transporter Tret1 [Trichonephila inaurata madagascariensis]|uniref:Facilitated trehalose transporter Tret1 n=1 Tax=Trichonephila inaurata madagascariensis TaxID=2747483 RepID=A0A8X6I7S9_9ARAC|nr:facilitated trehalose transporter Tret1 [Trichonephila inaurata madagascariensis]